MFLAQTASDRIELAPAIVLFATLFFSGLLIAWAGKKGVDGELKRNWMIGIRTKETIASDEAWRKSHQEAGKLLVVAGLVSAFAGLALLPRPSNGVAFVISAAGMVLTLIPILLAGVVAQRTAKEVNAKA